jgi:hypothetical protein
MKWFILIGISLFFIELITFEYPVNWEVFAESLSFSRQEIKTGFHIADKGRLQRPTRQLF